MLTSLIQFLGLITILYILQVWFGILGSLDTTWIQYVGWSISYLQVYWDPGYNLDTICRLCYLLHPGILELQDTTWIQYVGCLISYIQVYWDHWIQPG